MQNWSRTCRGIIVGLLIFAALGASAGQSGVVPFEAEIVPQIGHNQAVHKIVYSNSGRIVITGAKDSKIKIWANDGRLLRTLQVGEFKSFALSPDDSTLAVSKWGGGVELWSLLGERIQRFAPMSNVTMADKIAFSPAGDYLVACSATSRPNMDHCQEYSIDGTPGSRFANPTNGKSKSDVSGIAISPDGGRIFIGAGQSVYTYDRDGRKLGEFRATEGFLAALAISPDGELIATSDRDIVRNGSVPHTRLWHTDGRRVAEFPNHASWSVGFSTDSQWLVSGGWKNNRVLVIDRAGNVVSDFRVGKASVDTPAAVAISPDRSQIITAGKRFNPVRLEIWGIDGKAVGSFKQSNTGVTALDLDPNSGVILTASLDHKLRYWSMDGRLLRSHAANYDYPNLLAIAPNGRLFVSGGTQITLWDGSGKALATADVHKRGARAGEFTADGNYLLTGGIDGYVNIIPTTEGKQTLSFAAHDGDDVLSIAVHPDGGRFATGTTAGRFRIWDVHGNRLAEFAFPPDSKPPFSSVEAMQFTPDGEELVIYTTRRHEEIRIYNMQGELTRTAGLPVRNTYTNVEMAVSPDGKWLAASVNQQIALWELATLDLEKALSGHQGWISDIEFSADGLHLVSADTAGVIRLWNVATASGFSMLSQRDEWIIFTDDGYFDASRYGGDLVATVAELQGYSVDQFAVYFNRPDILYSRLGIESEDVIEHFRGYYERRLASLRRNADSEMIAPTVSVVSTKQDGKFVDLELESDAGADNNALLQIYVNDVPVYAGHGEKISGSRQLLDKRVELTSGSNKIEISLTNPAGIESLRKPLYFDYSRDVPGDLYFVGIGVSEYKNTELNLNYADDDVRDMGNFVDGYRGFFNDVHRLQLVDENVTRQSLAQIRHFLASASVDDTVIFLVSGHGGYDYKGVQYSALIPLLKQWYQRRVLHPIRPRVVDARSRSSRFDTLPRLFDIFSPSASTTNPLCIQWLANRLAERDRLGPLVLVVRETQVLPAAVQVEPLAEQVEAHHDALAVPAGTAIAPRRRPRRLVGLGELPQHEVGRMPLLVGAEHLALAAARAHVVERLVRQQPVVVDRLDRHVDAVVGA